MAVIAVFNQKGGVGKTTTCFNLAAALSSETVRPYAIDFDPQAHLSLSCGFRAASGADSVFAFFQEQKTLSQLARDVPVGLSLIPSHSELSKVDALYGKSSSITMRLKNGIDQDLVNKGVPILIDCCPIMGVLTLNAVIAADRVLVPVSADFLSLQSVNWLDSAFKVLEGPLKRRIERKLVLTRFDARRRLSFEIYDKLKERYGTDLCETRISENVSLAESPVHQKSIFHHAPSSQGAKDYAALTRELVNEGFFNSPR